jgi:hypothetical protein
MKESELLSQVLYLAWKYDVLAYHCYDSRVVTEAGFPTTYVLSSRTRTIFVELKIDDKSKGYLKPEQREYRDRLQAAGMEWYLWRPEQLEDGTIEQMIERLNNARLS